MADKKASRIVRVSLIQQGPMTNDIDRNKEDLLKKVEEVAEKEHPDFLMGIELSTTQYFCSVCDEMYFDLAEPIPGPTTELFAEVAKKYEMCLLLGIFEKTNVEDVYYDSVVVLGPDGQIIEGIMPDGTKVLRYVKNHIPYLPLNPLNYNERFYFKEGFGFPVFHTPKAKIGIVVCFDRRFSESFKMATLQGAEIVFNPANCFVHGPQRGAAAEIMYLAELQTRALESSVWVCATNKAGTEDVQGQLTTFYGSSSIIHPTGEIAVKAPRSEPAVISHDLDLEEVSMARRFLPLYEARRPELYTLICRPIQ
ncbi:carbon-nitrogen hydrolase family protein [Chloroflexota bacterium]